MAAFDSSVPRMISMYFGIAFSSSGGAASRPSHPHVERAARGSTRPRRNLSPRRSRIRQPHADNSASTPDSYFGSKTLSRDAVAATTASAFWWFQERWTVVSSS